MNNEWISVDAWRRATPKCQVIILPRIEVYGYPNISRTVTHYRIEPTPHKK